ncbi:MAG: FtsX-like permease family protein [Pseudomonadota bacterium]|nr:FtsX-like permease family protein [Pseudomonadota bacterium]
MLKPLAKSAKKALSLKKDSVFKLLVVMTILLGWLSAVGSGGLVGLENLYNKWKLEQSSQISVYLLADSNAGEIQKLSRSLEMVQGVISVKKESKENTKALLAPYFEDEGDFPLPVILDVKVNDTLKRDVFDAKVAQTFPEAEIDDARSLLTTVSKGVRFAQASTIGFALILFTVMALLVSLTVKAGLRGQKDALAVLQYIGATDGFITKLVVRQVLMRSLVGWFVASALGCLTLYVMGEGYPNFKEFLNQDVYVGALLTPVALVIVAVTAAWLTSHSVVQRAQKSA